MLQQKGVKSRNKVPLGAQHTTPPDSTYKKSDLPACKKGEHHFLHTKPSSFEVSCLVWYQKQLVLLQIRELRRKVGLKLNWLEITLIPPSCVPPNMTSSPDFRLVNNENTLEIREPEMIHERCQMTRVVSVFRACSFVSCARRDMLRSKPTKGGTIAVEKANSSNKQTKGGTIAVEKANSACEDTKRNVLPRRYFRKRGEKKMLQQKTISPQAGPRTSFTSSPGHPSVDTTKDTSLMSGTSYQSPGEKPGKKRSPIAFFTTPFQKTPWYVRGTVTTSATPMDDENHAMELVFFDQMQGSWQSTTEHRKPELFSAVGSAAVPFPLYDACRQL